MTQKYQRYTRYETLPGLIYFFLTNENFINQTKSANKTEFNSIVTDLLSKSRTGKEYDALANKWATILAARLIKNNSMFYSRSILRHKC